MESHEAVESQKPHVPEQSQYRAGKNTENTETDDDHGVIIKKEIRAGYKLNGKILYPAKVIV